MSIHNWYTVPPLYGVEHTANYRVILRCFSVCAVFMCVRACVRACVHEEKLICKLYFFNKKIYYFYNGAGIHSKCEIYTVKNKNFYNYCRKF